MKHLLSLFVSFVVPAFMLTGCDNISGDYGGENCVWSKISFKSGGTAYITSKNGNEIPAQYTVDGDKISITMPQAGIVMTKKGDVLEMVVAGVQGVCQKL